MSDTTAPADTPSENQQLLADATQNRDPVIQQDAAQQNAPSALLSDEQIAEMDTTDLKAELRQRDQPVSGNKTELADRLREFVAKAREDAKGAIATNQVEGGAVQAGEETKRAAETGGQLTQVSGSKEDEDGKAVEATTAVEGGGIAKTSAGADHTDLLQQMSADRRKAQLRASNRY